MKGDADDGASAFDWDWDCVCGRLVVRREVYRRKFNNLESEDVTRSKSEYMRTFPPSQVALSLYFPLLLFSNRPRLNAFCNA